MTEIVKLIMLAFLVLLNAVLLWPRPKGYDGSLESNKRFFEDLKKAKQRE